MEIKKFDKLIDLIINENEEQAKDLFHDIVVEKSREIYETIMAEEMMDDDLEEGMGGQVGDLADEITAEESGISEEEDEQIDIDSEEIFDIDGADENEAGDEVEDAVIRIEDKLDDLIAEFEEIMGKEDDLEGRDDEMDADLHDIEGDIDDQEVDVDVNVDDEELVAEAITLQKITAKMGDNGEQTRSPVDANSGSKGSVAKPVNFDDGNSGEQGRPAPTAKDVDGASGFQNQPGKNAKALSAAPKPVTTQASGVNTKSVIA
jgi:hypothetical protein